MAVTALGLPPPDLATTQLATLAVEPSRLFRVSRHDIGEPYFGHSGANRFDDPSKVYGTCYFGYDLKVALAETLLHDEVPEHGRFKVATDSLKDHYVISIQGSPLNLANLTGASLKRLSGHADLSATVDYVITQEWSLAVYGHPAKVDGFIYMSRHMNTNKAVVLFDRAGPKITQHAAVLLLGHKGFRNAKRVLGITAI